MPGAWGFARFDTANTYGGGASENILGQWLRVAGRRLRPERPDRDQGRQSPWLPARRDAAQPDPDRHHLDQSLRRLGLERIDLYYIHEFDRVTPLEETLEAMTRAVEAGKIARFGVSNAALADVQAIRNLAGGSLASRFDYVQNEYNMLATADAQALIPYCAEHGLRYTAFSPLAGGFLTGKYRFGVEPPAGQPPGPGARGLRRLCQASNPSRASSN